MNLKEAWQKTTKLLNSAFDLLPLPIVSNIEYPKATEDFKSFLEHNELELALDAIESLGNSNIVSDLFWERLAKAADCMGLIEREIELRNKIQNK